MKVLLIIPDGVGVRNFILGDFLRQAGEKGPVYALHTIPENLLTAYSNGLGHKVQWQALVPYGDKPLSFTLRNALQYAQMHWADTRAMRYIRNLPVRGSWRTQAARRAAYLIGRAAASSRGIHADTRGYHKGDWPLSGAHHVHLHVWFVAVAGILRAPR